MPAWGFNFSQYFDGVDHLPKSRLLLFTRLADSQ